MSFSKNRLFPLIVFLVLASAPAMAEDVAPNSGTSANSTESAAGAFSLSALGGFSIHARTDSSGYTSNAVTTSQAAFGARVGIRLSEHEDSSALVLGVQVDRYALSAPGYSDASVTAIMLQVFMRKIDGSGFYAGPEIGNRITSANDGVYSDSRHSFGVGAFAGYEFYFTPNISMGPEAHYDYYVGSGNGSFSSSNGTSLISPYDRALVLKGFIGLNLYL